MERIITEKMIQDFKLYLYEDEKTKATVKKYLRDLKKLIDFADGREVTKSLMIGYKEQLNECGKYKIRSINSYLVAANRFLEFMEWYDARVKTYRVQKESFCPEDKNITKADYKKLLGQARKEKKIRLYMILITLASTGMRVSEIRSVTVEAVRRGAVVIHNKGKVRTVLLTTDLQKQLRLYAAQEHIHSGILFRTRTGKAVDRSNIWREMKELCESAGVDSGKVFPHNLRHLFAQSFYRAKKDLAQLADILGHSSMETTRIYIRTTSKEHRKQLEKLDLVASYL